jgi:molybdopterin molybdotransferase
MLYGRLKELGCDVSYLNIASDSLDSLKSLINSSLDANLILTSGGISVGDKDYTLQAFQDIGMEIFFSKIDIKPGKPTTFGKLGNSFVVNLPGNPLASAVNFEMFVKPIVYKLQGLDVSSRVLKVKLKHNINLKRNKDTIILGVFDGEYFIPIKHQKPGMISPLGSFNSILQTSHNLKENDIVNIFAL